MNNVIVVTGAGGFIANHVVKRLNDNGFDNLLLVHTADAAGRLCGRRIGQFLANDFLEWLDECHDHDDDIIPDAVIHLGAVTDTTCHDRPLLSRMNVKYSRKLWDWCAAFSASFIYASSASTYGDGSNGFSDKTSPRDLKPMSPYARSKNDFDTYAMESRKAPPSWVGLKLFNVYGPGEAHKGHMASMVSKAVGKANTGDPISLFKWGQQRRDFVSVDDVVDVVLFMYLTVPGSAGLVNVGTGKPMSFRDTAGLVLSEFPESRSVVEYIDMPKKISSQYQAETMADISTLRAMGYDKPMTSVAAGIKAYRREI
jgi:ADP-L-glycero-D-manno-heptose 6-epimerase